MISWTFLLGPVVGGVIGGFTNKVAIKMLFRPFEAKYIGRIHIPFTPGIIPREKGRIAEAIGQVVSRELLNSEVLGKTLLSEEMSAKVDAALDGFLARMCTEEQSLNQFLQRFVDHEQLHRTQQTIEDDIVNNLYVKLDDPALGDRVAEAAMEQLTGKLSSSFFGRLGEFALGLMGDSVKSRLAENINEMIHNNGRTMIADLLHKESERLLTTPIRSLVEGKEQLLARLKEALGKMYRVLVSENLPKILDSINLQRTIEDRINDMSMPDTERLILDIASKELNALVWFGVLLGFMMGFITNLF